MAWLTTHGEYLLQGPSASLPRWAAALCDRDGNPICPARFYVVTARGEVSRTFSEPLGYSVGDERGVTNVHAVSGDSLVSFHVIDHVLLGTRIESRTEIAGLTPSQPGSVPFYVSDIIAAYEATAARRGSLPHSDAHP